MVRSRFALGYDVDYVPGWDCHGLPIEWKIEEEFRAQGPAQGRGLQGRVPRPLPRVRRATGSSSRRASSSAWACWATGTIAIRRWTSPARRRSSPSSTSSSPSHQLYRGSKPVMWSPVERTALADAEVEYHDHVSPTIWVKLPGDRGPGRGRRRGSVVIWTTTPWTIPGQPGDRLQSRHRLRRLRGRGAGGGPAVRALGQGRRAADPGREAGRARCAPPPRSPSWLQARAGRPAGHGLRPPAGGAGRRLRLPRAAAGRRPRHRRRRHGLRAHRARPRRRGLSRSGSRTAIARSPRRSTRTAPTTPDVPLFGGLKVLETEGKKAGKFGPANDAVIEGADRGRQRCWRAAGSSTPIRTPGAPRRR